MEPKKNPKKDMRKYSGLYFQVGLILMLLFVWRAIEWKTYEKKEIEQQVVQFDQLDEEEQVMVMPPNTPPPPPPPPPAPEPDVIEVVEDDVEIEEQVIESTEVTEEVPEIVEVSEVAEAPEEEPIADVPFSAIEDVPIFPGCERVNKSERRNCFQEQMNKHIKRNFRYPEIAQEMGIQGRVYVNFIISKNGSITNIRMRGPDKNLEKEAQRIIAKLPRMTPGKQRGRPVRVPFSIPITFRLR